MYTGCLPPDYPNYDTCMSEVMATLQGMEVKPFNPEHDRDLTHFLTAASTSASVMADIVMVRYLYVQIMSRWL